MKFTLLIFLIFISGCSPYIGRGNFELVSTENTLKKFEILSENRVEGRSCFDLVKSALFLDESVFELAVKNALSRVDEATTMLEVEFKDEGDCVVVSGIPAK